MAVENSPLDIETLEEALVSLNGVFAVCAPSEELTRTILSHCLLEDSKKWALVHFSPQTLLNKKRPSIDLSSVSSIRKAAELLERAVERLLKATRICVDLSQPLPTAINSGEKQQEFLGVLKKVCSARGHAVVVCFSRNVMAPETIAFLKDEVTYFLDITRTGPLLLAQFITAKGIYSETYFLPRIMNVTANAITMSSPIVPSSNYPASPSRTGDEAKPPESVIDLLESQYRLIFENAAEAMMLFELRGNYKELNKRAKDMLGCSDSEVLSLKLMDLVTSTGRFGALRSLVVLRKKGRLAFNTQVKRKSGRISDIRISASSIGKNTFVASISDISGWVQKEREAKSTEDEYRMFVSSLPYAYAIFINRKIAVRSSTFDLLFPWVKENAPSLSDFFGRRNAELLKDLSTFVDDSLSTVVMKNREVLIPTPERKTVAAEVSVSAVMYEGKRALYCTFTDVSERRRILDKAEDTEKRFRDLLAASLDPVSISQDDTFTFLNEAFARTFGYSSPIELLGKQITSVVGGRNARATILENTEKWADEDEGGPFRYEYTGLKKDGTKIDVEASGVRLSLDGKPAILVYHRDVTAQKKAEEEFQRKAKGLEILNRTSDDLSGALSIDEIYQKGLSASMRCLGFEIGALFSVDKNRSALHVHLHHGLSEAIIAKIGDQSLEEGLARFFNKTHEPVVVSIAEYPPYLHYKSLFESEQYKTLAFLPLVVNGTLYGVLMLASVRERTMDDNDRTVLGSLSRQLSSGIEKTLLAESALEWEGRYQTTVEHISEVLYTLQPDGTFVYISPNIEKLIGFNPADFRANAGLWRTLLHPDDRTSAALRITNQALDVTEFSLEYRIQPKGRAAYTWLRDEIRYRRNQAGMVTAIDGIITDITDTRRLAEIDTTVPGQAGKNDRYVHNLLNSINNVVYTVDSRYCITEVNKAWREFMRKQGLEQLGNEEAAIGQSLEKFIPDPEIWNHYKEVMDDLFARRIDTYSRDLEIPHDNEGTAYHLVINPMVIDEKAASLVFTVTDITDIRRTEDEIKRRNKELLALNTIASSISKSLELEEILKVATEQLQETFGASVVAFYLLDAEKRHLVLSRHTGIPDDYASSVESFDLGTSLVGRVILQRKPIYVSHSFDDEPRPELGIAMVAALGLMSTGIVPLQSKDRVPGAFLISFSKAHAFPENEQQLLLLIGNQIGAAIENAQLYSEVQRQVKTLTTLYELGKGLTGVLDLNSMLQVVYREITKALPLERFYYQAYLPEQNTLSLLSRTVSDVVEFYPFGLKVMRLPDWPNTIYQKVVAHGTPFLGSTNEAGTDSMIAVPIKSEEKVTGIISIVASAPDLYDDAHLRLLESIATLTGVAISKATLYDDTLRKSSEIENRNKELDDFTYVVSHDLKEPLISIEGYSKIVLRDFKDKLDDEGREYLGAVVQSTTRMKHLIDDLLTLSRLGRMSEAYESVSVRVVIEEILHDLQFSLKEKNVVVTVSDQLPNVRYSSTRLSMVFRNLLSNAMKFNDKPDPRIHIDVAEGENEYVFSVSDNGIGIEPQYFDRIFTIFQRLKRSEEYRGTGAGLTIAKKIVEREGGKIWVDSVPGNGSTFYFTIRKPA